MSCPFPFVLVPPSCLVAVPGILSGVFFLFRSFFSFSRVPCTAARRRHCPLSLTGNSSFCTSPRHGQTMEPQPLGGEVVWPGSRAACSPHVQYPPHWQIKKARHRASSTKLAVAGSFPSATTLAVVCTVPSWRRPGPLHVPVRPLTAEAVPHSARSQRRVRVALHTLRPEIQTRMVLLQR